MMKSFQRAIRRADLEGKYSKGFNPHMRMIFGAPLSLGFISEAEYADLFFEQDYEPDYIIQKLSKNLPEGLPIMEAGIYTGRINIMADISFAEYSFIYNGALSVEKVVELVSESNSVIVEKVGKSRSKIVDVRPLILKITTDGQKIKTLVRAGNNGNLNPRLLVEAIKTNMDYEAMGYSYKRISQYVQRDGKMYNPLHEKILLEGENNSI